MGMYYGVVNYTKKHNVSSYWKGSPPEIEEIKDMIIKYNWNEDDIIVASCYCRAYQYKNGEYVDLESEQEYEEESEQEYEEESEQESESEQEQEQEQESESESESVQESESESESESEWKNFSYDSEEEFDEIFFCG